MQLQETKDICTTDIILVSVANKDPISVSICDMQNPHRVAHFYHHHLLCPLAHGLCQFTKNCDNDKTVLPGAEAEAVCALPTRYTRQLCTAITLASLTAPVPLWKMPHFIHSDITGWCSSGLSGFLHRNWICGTHHADLSSDNFRWYVPMACCVYRVSLLPQLYSHEDTEPVHSSHGTFSCTSATHRLALCHNQTSKCMNQSLMHHSWQGPHAT